MFARRSCLALTVLIAIVAGRSASAAVDISGGWDVVVQSSFIGPQAARWVFQQSGSQLSLTILYDQNPPHGPFPGTIDPVSGVFYIDTPDNSSPPPFPTCGDNRIDGTAAADGHSLTGTYASYFFQPTPPLVGCNQDLAPFSGSRCTPGTPGCCAAGMPCCGNGVVENGEQCDDRNTAAGDCCSPTCQFETLGAACGTTCAPGTCDSGSCATTPAQAGTTCDDGNSCTFGDSCNGSGACVSSNTVTCGLCQECDGDGSCVYRPRDSCQSSERSKLKLTVRDPSTPRATWSYTSASVSVFGDPNTYTEYTLCIFDDDGLLAGGTIPLADDCDGRLCWRRTKTGFDYRDPAGANSGILKVTLQAVNSTKIKTKIRGPNFGLPATLAGVGPPLVVQLSGDDLSQSGASACWEDRYDADAIDSSGSAIKARH